MSETVSAPPPGIATTSTPDAPSAPPPISQPSISVSEAARLLNQQRRQGAQTAPQATEAPAAPQPRREAQTPPATPTAPAAAPSGDAALDSMAKALGLDGVTAAQVPAAVGLPGIEIDGRQLSADEVRRAVSMASDYTRKTQALAEQARQVQEQQQALAMVLPLLQPELARIQQQIAGVPAPDAALIETNPQEYLRQMAAWQANQQEQGRLGQLTQVQQEAQNRAMAAQVERSNQELAKEYPQWADPAQRVQWQQRIADWATNKAGFGREELQRLSDHRQLKVLMKAMLFDHMAGGARTAAPVAPAPVRGQTPPPAPAERITAADQAFNQRPNIRNATALLTARRAAER